MKKQGPLSPRREVIRPVLKYLISNPDAKDTTEGVRRWWLTEGRCEQRPVDVDETLQFLVAKNWLTMRITPQQEKLYGLNKLYLQEIVDFLNGDDSDGEL